MRIDGSTSNGGVDVSLPPAYEGSFSLTTSNAALAVQDTEGGAVDPSGKGRKRTIKPSTIRKGHLFGWVYWSKENDRRGSVVLKSSNGPVTLFA